MTNVFFIGGFSDETTVAQILPIWLLNYPTYNQFRSWKTTNSCLFSFTLIKKLFIILCIYFSMKNPNLNYFIDVNTVLGYLRFVFIEYNAGVCLYYFVAATYSLTTDKTTIHIHLSYTEILANFCHKVNLHIV